MCYSRCSLSSITTSRKFTWNATSVSLEPILKISLSCILLSITTARYLPGFRTMPISLNQFKVTSHGDSKDPLNSLIAFPKHTRRLSPGKLCEVNKNKAI